MENNNKKQQLDVTGLGFKSTFKATCGFYLAQTVMTILGLIVLVSLISVAAIIVQYSSK